MDTTRPLCLQKPDLTPGQWELYTFSNSPSVMSRVARALNNAAFRAMKDANKKLAKLPFGTPPEKAKLILRDAYQNHLWDKLEKYASYGAMDTEPRAVAAGLMASVASWYGVHMTSWDF